MSSEKSLRLLLSMREKTEKCIPATLSKKLASWKQWISESYWVLIDSLSMIELKMLYTASVC